MFAPRFEQKLSLTKKILLFVWVIGAFFSLQTGEQAQKIRGKSNLIHTHEEFAEKAYMSYVIIAIIYILQWISTSNAWRVLLSQRNQNRLASIVTAKYIARILWLISIIWFILLSITGALGGAITHGKTVDPIVWRVVDTFVK